MILRSMITEPSKTPREARIVPSSIFSKSPPDESTVSLSPFAATFSGAVIWAETVAVAKKASRKTDPASERAKTAWTLKPPLSGLDQVCLPAKMSRV